MQGLSVLVLRKIAVISVVSLYMLGAAVADAGPEVELSNGQTLYVPVYSHTYGGNKEMPFYLAATISIRNTDPRNSINIIVADYHDSQGRIIRKFAQNPITISPFSSSDIVIGEADKSGGSGAFFIVKWSSGMESNPPLIEAVMIGTHRGQGISFTSRGRIIRDTRQRLE